MLEKPHSDAALMGVAVLVLVAGCASWVFPEATGWIPGSWWLPVVSMAGLAMALVLAVDWPWLRGFLLVLAVTLIIAWAKVPDSTTGTSHFAGASLGLLLMLVVGRVACSQKRLRWAMLAFFSAGMVVLILGLASTELSNPASLVSILIGKLFPLRLELAGLEPGGRVNQNALAAAALLIVPVGILALVLRSREKIDRFGLQPLGLLVVSAGLLVIAVSHSRSALLAAWLTLVAVLVRGLRWWGWRLLIGTVVMAFPLAAIVSVHATSREDFLLKASLFWRTVADRVFIMSSGVDRWRESPWSGIGLNRFRHVYKPPPLEAGANPGDLALWPSREYDVAHAHNVFLQTALDVGVIGLGAYCGVLGFLLFRADQAIRGPTELGRVAAAGSALSLVAVSTFGLSDAVVLGAKIGLIQWLAAGLILAAWRVQQASVRHAP